jgi:hypothetical protein
MGKVGPLSQEEILELRAAIVFARLISSQIALLAAGT